MQEKLSRRQGKIIDIKCEPAAIIDLVPELVISSTNLSRMQEKLSRRQGKIIDIKCEKSQ